MSQKRLKNFKGMAGGFRSIIGYGLGFGAIGSSFYLMYWKRKEYTSQSCFQDSIDILKQNKAAMEIIGEPIKVGAKLSLLTGINQLDKYGGKCQLNIPIQGTKSKASLMIVARRKPVAKDCNPADFPRWKLKLIYLGVIKDKKVYQIYGKVVDEFALQLDNPMASKYQDNIKPFKHEEL